MIQGSSSDNNVQMVKQGFDDMLADTDLHVVYEANCDGWTAELAAGYVEEALEKYPHVKGIMCGNDDIASQVVQVLDRESACRKCGCCRSGWRSCSLSENSRRNTVYDCF